MTVRRLRVHTAITAQVGKDQTVDPDWEVASWTQVWKNLDSASFREQKLNMANRRKNNQAVQVVFPWDGEMLFPLMEQCSMRLNLCCLCDIKVAWKKHRWAQFKLQCVGLTDVQILATDFVRAQRTFMKKKKLQYIYKLYIFIHVKKKKKYQHVFKY